MVMNSRSQKWAGISRPAMGTGCSVSAPPPRPSRPLRVPGMVKWKGRAALVTGASSAIGYAVVRQLTEQGMNVVGCTRNIPKLESLATELRTVQDAGQLMAEKCDMKNEQDIIEAFRASKAYFGGVDVCITCARLSHDTGLLSGDTADWREMLEVNVLGLSICAREFIKQLHEREVNNGHLVIINSVNTGVRGKFTVVAKQAISAVVEGLQQEMTEAKSNTKVTEISLHTEGLDSRLSTEAGLMEVGVPDHLAEQAQPGCVANTVVYVLSAPSAIQVRDLHLKPVSYAAMPITPSNCTTPMRTKKHTQ